MSDQQPEKPAAQDAAARDAMDRLNEQNRVLVNSVIADRGALAPDAIEQIRQHFIAYVRERKIDAAAVARQVDYSASVITTWMNGKYSGNVGNVAAALNDWMERDGRRAKSERPKDYIPTQIAEDMRAIAYLADKRGMMAAIVVPAGAGKSYVLKALAEELRGLYVYCSDRMAPLDLLDAIAAGLGRRGEGGTKFTILRWIVSALKGTRRVIFLDEAQRLSKALGVVRSIHDEAGVPIIMAGSVEMLDAINDRTDGRGQFSSRTIRYNALDQARNAETDPDGSSSAGRDLFSIEEVRRFFDMKKIRLDADALRFLWLLACLPNFGCLRLIEHAVETIFDFAPGIEVITRQHVLTALKMLHGADAVYMERLTQRHVEISTAAARVA